MGTLLNLDVLFILNPWVTPEEERVGGRLLKGCRCEARGVAVRKGGQDLEGALLAGKHDFGGGQGREGMGWGGRTPVWEQREGGCPKVDCTCLPPSSPQEPVRSPVLTNVRRQGLLTFLDLSNWEAVRPTVDSFQGGG